MNAIKPDPESNAMEWKEKTPEVSKILKAVVGFANQYGGRIIIGIRNDGVVTGLQDDEIQADLEMLSEAIYSGCSPALITHIYPVTYGNKNTLVIDVSEGMNKPYFVKSLGLQKGTFVRVGRSTLLATAEVLTEIQWRSKGRSYDTMPIFSSTPEDLSDAKFSEFRKQLKQNHRSSVGPKSEWTRLKLLSDFGASQQATTGGVLLFGTSPQDFLPEAKIYCSFFKGTAGRDAIAHLECIGTLFEQYDSALSFLESHIPTTFRVRQTRKKEDLVVPRVALREALSNLLVHRDYAMNAPSKIAIFSDRIEFFSPGVFPGPFSKQNLESGFTYIRNQIITLFFHKAGIIERLGTGFTTILRTYRSMSDIEPEIIEGDGFVKCILPFIQEPKGSKMTANSDSRSNSQARQDWKSVRRLFHRLGAPTAADLQGELQISRSGAIRLLNKLIDEGEVKKEGQGPKTVYLWIGPT
jgi:ATP-dependent DNA helicase RecG